MTAIPTPAPVVPGRLEQMSTRIAFFIAGFGIAAWAPLVPYAKARVELNEGTLGLLLLCLGAARSSPCRWPAHWPRAMVAGAY